MLVIIGNYVLVMASLRFIRNLSLETKRWDKINTINTINTINKKNEKYENNDTKSIIFYKKPKNSIIPIRTKDRNTKTLLLYILLCGGGICSAGFGISSIVYTYTIYDDISTLFL